MRTFGSLSALLTLRNSLVGFALCFVTSSLPTEPSTVKIYFVPLLESLLTTMGAPNINKKY
jgi:hypothetical protein